MWFHWRPLFQWAILCPIVFADPIGLLVVMPRATQPVPRDRVDALPDYYPEVTRETKAEDFGLVREAIVVLDYGLPFEEAVHQRRSYYASFNGRPAQEVTR